MLEEKYKAKVEGMRIYVPLLTKLITKLEAKNDESEENVEKISQLKILLEQLLDPKPGISFEELNDCHEVMQNLFASAAKLKTQSSEQIELRNKNSKETVNILSKDTEKDLAAATKNVNQVNQQENPSKHIPKETTKSNDLIHENSQIEADKAQSSHEALENQVKEAKQISLQDENLGPNQEKTQNSTNKLQQQVKVVKEDTTNDESETSDNELENVEVIVFSEDEYNESFEEEEMILPDNEDELLFVDPRESNKKEHGKEETSEIEDESEMGVEKEHKYEEKRNQVRNMDNSMEEIEKIQNEIENVSVENNEISHNEVEPYESLDLESNEELIVLAELDESEQNTTKRANSETNDTYIPKTKKVRTWDPVTDIEIEAAIETVSALADSFVDPLAADDLKLNLNIENLQEPVAEHNNADVDDENDDDDDVEIIESRHSPILIESDDEDMADASDVVDSDTAVKKTDATPKSTSLSSNNAMQEPALPSNNAMQEPALPSNNAMPEPALPSNNATQKPALPSNNAMQEPVHPTREIVISNVTSLSGKSKNYSKTVKRPAAKKRPNIAATATSRLLPQRSTISLQQQRNTLNLQPKMICGPNPQLFSTKVGDRNLLIPNAFYGNSNRSPVLNPDIAHCRWLENFLRHFCSPFNIAHNTCFLLLQRAVREEDFFYIQKHRLLLNVTKGEVGHQLLNYMQKIFFVNGNPLLQKLTFVGRKFCNLAFVNILDKTISLTIDWRTNGVTSRTRISTASFESVSQQKTKTTSATQATSIHVNTNSLTLNSRAPAQIQTINAVSSTAITNSPATNQTSSLMPVISTFSQSSVIPAATIETLKPNDIDEGAVNTQGALRSVSRCENDELSNRFVYSDEENGVDLDDGSDQEFLPEKAHNKLAAASKSKSNEQDHGPVDVSAFVNDYTSNKQPLNGKPKQSQKNQTFEMAFLERLAHEDKDIFVCGKGKGKKYNSIVIIDDDDDEEVTPKNPAKLPLEPRLATNKPVHHELQPEKNLDPPVMPTVTAKLPLEPGLATDQPTNPEHIKNTDSSICLTGNNRYFCLICRRKVIHIVNHYVNMHPWSEVHVSRPAPKYAHLLMENRTQIAKYTPARNNLSLYLAMCVFCEKKGSFTISYWYQHFASHTGEYSYHCTGCGIRKLSRFHLLSHLPNCPKEGTLYIKYQYDCTSLKIPAFMCRLCNYTQMNLENVEKHLLCQHGFDCAAEQLWVNVTLLEIPSELERANASSDVQAATIGTRTEETNETNIIKSSTLSESQTAPSIIIRDSNGDIFEITEVENGNSYAVDLTSNTDPAPLVVNEAENDSQMNDMEDVEGFIHERNLLFLKSVNKKT